METGVSELLGHLVPTGGYKDALEEIPYVKLENLWAEGFGS